MDFRKSVISQILRSSLILLLLYSLSACQGSIISQMTARSFPNDPRNYKPAGFTTASEVEEYRYDSLYFAYRISPQEWESFYRTFPEYWLDTQLMKQYTLVSDYNVGYTAYAFRWLTLKKKKTWDENTVKRLTDGKSEEGDDIFKIIYSLGAQKRLIWDNDFEILIYPDRALILNNGICSKILECNGCSTLLPESERMMRKLEPNKKNYILREDEVLSILKLQRPKY